MCYIPSTVCILSVQNIGSQMKKTYNMQEYRIFPVISGKTDETPFPLKVSIKSFFVCV